MGEVCARGIGGREGGDLTYEFKFSPDDREVDDSVSLNSAVFQALGAASACWEYLERAGVFDSEQAERIGQALLQKIREDEGPKLGLATTRQLLEEIKTRIDMDWYNGGGGLNYTTVEGRPDERHG